MPPIAILGAFPSPGGRDINSSTSSGLLNALGTGFSPLAPLPSGLDVASVGHRGRSSALPVRAEGRGVPPSVCAWQRRRG